MQVRQQTGGRFVSSPSLQNRFQRDFLFGNRSGVDRRFNLLGQIVSGGNVVLLLVVIVFASGRRASVRRRVLLLLASSRSDFGGGPFSNFRTSRYLDAFVVVVVLLLFGFFFERARAFCCVLLFRSRLRVARDMYRESLFA